MEKDTKPRFPMGKNGLSFVLSTSHGQNSIDDAQSHYRFSDDASSPTAVGDCYIQLLFDDCHCHLAIVVSAFFCVHQKASLENEYRPIARINGRGVHQSGIRFRMVVDVIAALESQVPLLRTD